MSTEVLTRNRDAISVKKNMSSHPKADRNLLILFSVVVLDLIGFGVVVPILPFYAQQYGASATILGILLASYSGMQFLFSSVWGRLSDHIGRKNVLLLTMGGSAVGLFILGTAHSLVMLFVGRILAGIFAANVSVASAYITDITTEENRTKGMGMIGAAFGVGFLLGPALGGALSKQGYHVPILTAAGLSIANMIYASWRLKEPARHHHVEAIKTKVLADKYVLKMCILYLVFTLGVTQLESVFAFFMKDKFGFDAMHVAYILALMALVMIGVQGGGIRSLSKKYGEKKLLLVGSLILTTAFMFVPLLSQVSFLLIPLTLSSFGRGIAQPAMMSLVSKKASPHMRGSVMGTFQASASLGRVVGPFVAGVLYDQWHASPFYLASILLVIVMGISISL